MKKRGKLLIIISLFAMITSFEGKTQNMDWAGVTRYAKQNDEIKNDGRKITAVLMGNSITEMWADVSSNFFAENNYLGRGIGGQTSPQMLTRFREDVVALKPKVVVINAGINDIAENTGPYDFEHTIGYIKSMAEIAHANGIKVILTSILPAGNIPWNHKITYVPDKIDKLNAAIKGFAATKKFAYVDYYSSLVDKNRNMKSKYTSDGVHVTKEGYEVMEKIIKKAIKKAE